MVDIIIQIQNVEELKEILSEIPSDARVVTDVGASMCSGWGDLYKAEYTESMNILELFFS